MRGGKKRINKTISQADVWGTKYFTPFTIPGGL